MHSMVHFLFLALSLFFFGACVGSFCGVLMETNVKRSFWTGRSQCLTCQEHLKWYELIPVVSYVIQWGRCRKCHAMIPTWVVSIEIMCGLLWMLFGIIFVTEQYSIFSIVAHLAVITMMLMLALEDIKSFSIPDRLSIPMTLIVICLMLIYNHQYESGIFPSVPESILGALCGMMFYLVQMMIPGIWSLIGKKQYIKAVHVLFTPLFFPFWLTIK